MNFSNTMALALVASALATGAGCGKSTKSDSTSTTAAAVEGKGMKGSCNLRKETSTCSEESDKSDPMGLAKGLCDALKGTWSTDPCPKDNIVGTCSDKDGSVTSYYADGDAPRDLDDAKASCEVINEGKFTAIAAPKPKAVATAAPAAAPQPTAKSGKPAKR